MTWWGCTLVMSPGPTSRTVTGGAGVVGDSPARPARRRLAAGVGGRGEASLRGGARGGVDPAVGAVAGLHEVGARRRTPADHDARVVVGERRARQLLGVAHREELGRRELLLG